MDAEAWRKVWPYLPFCDQEILDKCKAYPARDEVFICSFPKSGTTWMQNIVFTLLTKGTDRSFGQISDRTPMLEHRRTWAASEPGQPPALATAIAEQTASMPRRAFNTHLLWHLLPTASPKARFIYVVRQGEDAMVSFYHHLKNQQEGNFEGDFPAFFEESMAGTSPFGRWTDHLASFLPVLAAGDPRVMLVSYEQMKADLAGVVLKVAKHLDLKISEKDVEPLLSFFTFEAMKGTPQFQPTSVSWKEGFQFVRKGIVGDYKNLFQGDMEDRFLAAVRKTGVLACVDPWASAGEHVEACGLRYLEGSGNMKVSIKKSAGFYVKLAQSFFAGSAGKDGKENPPVDLLHISGLGSAINVAASVATRIDTEGWGTITKIETANWEMGASQSYCARIFITMVKK